MGFRIREPGETQWRHYYFVKNAQGDVMAMYRWQAAGSSSLVCTYTYDPWGKSEVRNSNGTVFNPTLNHVINYNPFRYRGYYYDIDTELYYLQSRYYDPAIGRFINADAYVGTGQGLLGYNMFAYCNNNPVNRTDSSGEFAFLTMLAVGAISGIANGISSSLSGGSFWKGFVIGGVVGTIATAACMVLPSIPQIATGVRMISSAVSNVATLAWNGSLTRQSLGAAMGDMVMDGLFSTIGYYYNPFHKTAKILFDAATDGITDVAETYLYSTPNTPPSPAKINQPSSSNATNIKHLTVMEKKITSSMGGNTSDVSNRKRLAVMERKLTGGR